jgi:demethylspheroidene O-methyltransferase
MTVSTTVNAPPAAAPRLGERLRERVRERRDRWLADPAWREAAIRFPLTRPLARRQAATLFDLMAGFVYSQVLSACVELRLFDRLARAPLAAGELAAEHALPLASAARLLEAAAALELVECRPSLARPDVPETSEVTYGLGPLGATLVGNEALAALVRHHAALYRDLQDPLALLRARRGDSQLARLWSYATAGDPGALAADEVAPYSAVMTSSQALIAAQVLDAYPLRRHRVLLDIGGGEGAFVAAALERAPHLRAQLFDLPAVAERARVRLAESVVGRPSQPGLEARVSCHGGDFKATPLAAQLPRGADLVSFVRVLYDHDDSTALKLLTAAREVLPRGGTVLVAEPMAGTPGAQRMGAAYFGIYLLAMGSGRVRSAAGHIALLREAGFAAVRQRRTALPLQTGLIVARAP